MIHEEKKRVFICGILMREVHSGIGVPSTLAVLHLCLPLEFHNISVLCVPPCH